MDFGGWSWAGRGRLWSRWINDEAIKVVLGACRVQVLPEWMSPVWPGSNDYPSLGALGIYRKRPSGSPVIW